MEVIWKLIDSCITPIITYCMEVCDINKKETKQINQILDGMIKRILMIPKTTPREALYVETGLLDIENTIIKNRINYNVRVLNTDKINLGILTRNDEKGSWKEKTNKLIEEYQITTEDMTGKKESTKRKIGIKIRNKFKNNLETTGKTKSKIKFLLDNKQEWTIGKPAQYMNKLNRYQASIIFKTRSRMLEVKNNYKNKYRDHKCRLCNIHEEDQMHVLQTCPELQNKGLETVTIMEIFNEDAESLKKTAKKIDNIMQAILKPPPPPLTGN